MNSLLKIFGASCIVLACALLAGCPNNNTPSSGPLPTPIFIQFEIPDPNGANTWLVSSTISPPPEVLPTRGRGVRVSFSAAVGSSFSVSLRALDGSLTPLPENQGTPAPPEDGYFQIRSVDVNAAPPIYHLYLRAPLALGDPANFDVLIVTRSLRTDVTDSAPLVVSLRQRKIFTVTVQVNGNGHVTSNPAGIQCGTSPSGRALTDCSYEFGPGPVSLNPGSNDLNTTKFIGWTGNCAPGVQVCTFALTGMAATSATATFGPSTMNVPVSSCPAAPVLPGLRWIDLPNCATNVSDAHLGIGRRCDAQGWFCCEPGPMNSNAPRCGGSGQIERAPDCRHRAPKGTLRQPGGCYEVDSFP